MQQRTLKAAYKFYCDQNLTDAHSAEADVKATYEVLKAQIKRYEDVEHEDKYGNISDPVKNDEEKLHNFINHQDQVDFAGRIVKDENEDEVFKYGKHRRE